jgi:HK97 family phage portal protein
MGLLTWAGKILRLTDGKFWSAYYGGETWAGRPVNEENSLQLAAWWRGVKLYYEVTGTTPIKFYERIPDGSRRQVTDHPIAAIVSSDPNIDQTTQEFWGAHAAALVVQGNAFAEKRFVGERIVALEQLPYDTRPQRNRDNVLEYHYTDRGKSETLPREKVFHTKGFGFGGDVGLSPLAAARQTLSIALATEEAAGKTFSQGMRNSGFFTGPRLNPEQRKQFTETFIDPIVGNDAKAHYGILENGFDFKAINIPPKDAEMLLSRRYSVEEIARFLGMPPILLGHSADGQTMWGTGIGAIITMWRTLGLDSFFTTIEKSINKRLLTAAERTRFYAEFDRNAILQADPPARAEMYWKLVQIAGLTPNQICDKENFPRFEGGDVRLVNSTLQPLATLGQKPPARIQPAPGEPIPEPTP